MLRALYTGVRRTPTSRIFPLLLALIALPASAASDFDKDGISDLEDDCPTHPGSKENGGCPVDAPPAPVAEDAMVEVSSTSFDIKMRIEFEVGSVKLEKSSEPILFAVSQAIQRLPTNKSILIRGHTDNQGSRKGNLRLSRLRAAAVMKRLISAGIEVSRLRSEGLGPDEPFASNDTARGRARNRRVEFEIVEAADSRSLP